MLKNPLESNYYPPLAASPNETLSPNLLTFQNYEAFQGLLPAKMGINQEELSGLILKVLRRDLDNEQISQFYHQYRINFVEARHIPGQSEFTRGTCTDDEIAVCVGAPGERNHWRAVRDLLAHEIGHAVYDTLGRINDHEKPYEERDQEKYARYYVNEFRTFFGRFAKKQKRK